MRAGRQPRQTALAWRRRSTHGRPKKMSMADTLPYGPINGGTHERLFAGG